MRKITISVLTICVLLTGAVFANDVDYYKNLPHGDPLKLANNIEQENVNGLNFNEVFWENRGLVVYGMPSDVPGNEKKKAIYDSKTNQWIRASKGTIQWRYLGQDYKGNPFSNEHFPHDSWSGKPLSDKNWLYKPWEQGLCIRSDYDEDENFREIINSAIDFSIENGINPNGSSSNVTEAFGYANVMSMSTLQFEGALRMWHRTGD